MAVRVESLVVLRGGRRVLDTVSCAVPAGRVTGLLGPSGCGKTTLLRSVVGVQRTTAGTVEVLGRPAGDAALRGSVGYATQATSVYADLTARENVAFFAALHGSGAVDRALSDVALGPLAGRLVAGLSGGERARVSLACALVGSPELLVLDEPTVGLDPVLRRDLWQLFHELAAGGTTLLVSSHVLDEASRCDRLLLLREGRLLADQSPDGLRAQTGEGDLERAFLRLVEGAQ